MVSQDYTHLVAGEDMPFVTGAFSSAESVCVGIVSYD
jgi:hypothetical protein